MKWLFLALTLSAATAAETEKAATAPVKAPSKALAALAQNLPAAAVGQLLNIANQGDLKSLLALPGIGEVRAAAVVAGRPYQTPIDLLRVRGIGEATLTKILQHAQAGFPNEPRKALAPPN